MFSFTKKQNDFKLGHKTKYFAYYTTLSFKEMSTSYNRFELHFSLQVIHEDSLLILSDILIKIISFEKHLQ